MNPLLFHVVVDDVYSLTTTEDKSAKYGCIYVEYTYFLYVQKFARDNSKKIFAEPGNPTLPHPINQSIIDRTCRKVTLLQGWSGQPPADKAPPEQRPFHQDMKTINDLSPPTTTGIDYLTNPQRRTRTRTRTRTCNRTYAWRTYVVTGQIHTGKLEYPVIPTLQIVRNALLLFLSQSRSSVLARSILKSVCQVLVGIEMLNTEISTSATVGWWRLLRWWGTKRNWPMLYSSSKL